MKTIKILKKGNGCSMFIEALGLFVLDPVFVLVPNLANSAYYTIELSVDDATFDRIKDYVYCNSTEE